ERERPARGRERREASAFKRQPVELALADDDLLRVGEYPLPAVKLRVRARRGEHLGAGGLVVRPLGQLEEGELPGAVEDRDGDPTAVPAQKVQVDNLGGNPPRLLEVLANVRRQVAVVFACKLQAFGH